MSVAIQPTDETFELLWDGQPWVVVDDLSLTVWGETHRLAAGGLDLTGAESTTGSDEIGSYEALTYQFQTASLRHSTALSLRARCYELEPVLLLELLPGCSQPVYGEEAAGGARISALPGCQEGVFIHQRVNEYGRDAVGSWWAQALHLADPSCDQRWDWGLAAGWRGADGRCGALLAMRAGGAISRFRGSECGLDVVATGCCGRHVYPRLPLFLVAFGPTAAEAVTTAFAAASRLTEWSFRLREAKPFPRAFEYLGYSSWGACGRKPSLSRLTANLASLRAHNVPVRWLMIDEGWQQVDEHGRLTGYGAAARRFPGGLAAAIRDLQVAGGLRHVGVWTTLQGSWAGLAPESTPARPPERCFTGVDGTLVPHPSELGRPFWDDYFAALSRAGVDLVKLDNQGSGRNLYLGRLPLDEGVGRSLVNAERAADGSGIDLIASMCHHTECLYRFRSTNVVRVAADIVPSDRRAAKLHLAHSVGVAAWLGELAWPDADAFPSTHPAARAFAMVNCLLGGPVHLCDRADEHDLDLLGRLALSDGRLLQPQCPGRPPDRQAFADPLAGPMPLVVCAQAAGVPRDPPEEVPGRSDPTPVTFVGMVNVQLSGEPLDFALRPAELDLPPAEHYAVLAHWRGERRVLAHDEAWEVTLAELEAELFSVCPIVAGKACLGNPDKLLGACGCAWDPDDLVSTAEPGPVLLYDATGRTPLTARFEPLPLRDQPGRLHLGEAWRDGDWVLVNSSSTVFRMVLSAVSAPSPEPPAP